MARSWVKVLVPMGAVLSLAVVGFIAWRLRARPLAGPPVPPRFARTLDGSHAWKGNLHTHTNLSDGGDAPADVIAWYQSHGYDFLALTDHNVLSSGHRQDTPDGRPFALIAGEEVSMWVDHKQVHVNALCTHALIDGGTFPTAVLALDHAVSAAVAQGGVALINHPNFDWALTPADVLSAKGAKLLEIGSGHPYVHTAGDAEHVGHEGIWDMALTAGRDVAGVAVDDTHHLAPPAEPAAYPGVASVRVIAETLDEAALCAALQRGDVLSSMGEEPPPFRVEAGAYAVMLAGDDPTVLFIGSHGMTLARMEHMGNKTATYRPTGVEGYVRVRIETSTGRAWLPAVRVIAGSSGG